MNGEPAGLVVEDLEVGYGTRSVLSGVSLDVAPGEFVGLIGPNACGKSTLLKAVSRVLRPAAGRVLIDGRDVWRSMSLGETARTLAVVPQDFPSAFPFTVEETVALGRTPYLGRLRGEQPRDFASTREAMRAAGVLALKDRVLAEMAGGERQRVILAKALAQEPRLLLLDEPTSHLDVGHQVEILDLLLDLNRRGGPTVVIVLHDLNLAAMYCDRLYLLSGGRLVARGRPEEVLEAGRLEDVYGSPVLVGRHPVHGCPEVTLLSPRLAGEAARSARASSVARKVGRRPETGPGAGVLPVHVVGGGGSAGGIIEGLVAAGFRVTTGPLNAGDSDWQVARSLGVKVVAVPPFTEVGRRAMAATVAAMKEAAAVVVAAVPFGRGNVAVLEAALDVARAGRPVAVVTGGGRDAMASRDFTGGRATALAAELWRAGATPLGEAREVLAWASELDAQAKGQGTPLEGSDPA